jgi:putative transposase
MARSLRLEFGGAYYHVMARGNRREPIFRDDPDRTFFLRTLGEACGRTGWRVHAYVLMRNHYHLCLETPEPNLVAGMKWLQNTYTRRFNTRHRLWGRLFGDRYKAVPVEPGPTEYYLGLLDYLHLNPVRARLIATARQQSLLDFPWSSLSRGYALPPRERPAWLSADAGLAAWGFPDTTAGRRQFVERLDRRAREEELTRCGVPPLDVERDARHSHLRRGWYWGSQAFAEKLRALLEKNSPSRNRTYRSSPQAHAHDERRARELLQTGLREQGLTPSTLRSLPGNDPRKVKIALQIRQQTSVSNQWLNQALHMRSPANVSQILLRATRQSRYVD